MRHILDRCSGVTPRGLEALVECEKNSTTLSWAPSLSKSQLKSRLMSSSSQIELSSFGSLSSGSLSYIYRNTSVFVEPILAAIQSSRSLSHIYQLRSRSTRVLDMDPSVHETLSAGLGINDILISSYQCIDSIPTGWVIISLACWLVVTPVVWAFW